MTAEIFVAFAIGVLSGTGLWWCAVTRWRGLVAEYEAALDRSVTAMRQAHENTLTYQRMYCEAQERLCELDPNAVPPPMDGESRESYFARCGVKDKQ